MQPDHLIAIAVCVVLAIAWKYSRRRLSEKELAAWERRANHPTPGWVRVVATCYAFLVASMFAVTFGGEVVFGRRPGVGERFQPSLVG